MENDNNQNSQGEEKAKVKKSKKKWIWGIVVFIFLAIIASGGDESKKTSTQPDEPQQETQNKEATKEPEQPKFNADHQKMVLEFEQSIYKMENSAKPAMEKFVNDMQNVGNTVSVYDAYASTRAAKDTLGNLSSEFHKLKAPDGLPKDIKKSLNEVSQELSTAYYSKEKALESAMEFLDNQKPSALDKFKEENSMADQFIFSATAKLLDVKTQVGIDLTKESSD